MDRPFYHFETVGADAKRFEFVSQGLRPVRKRILYSETGIPDFYNLALADLDADGLADYESVSNNGDMEQVLATVARTLLAFFADHPTANVAFTGSTPARTRLYQVALAREIRAASTNFIILGLHSATLEPFRLNRSYDGFVVTLIPNSLKA